MLAQHRRIPKAPQRRLARLFRAHPRCLVLRGLLLQMKLQLRIQPPSLTAAMQEHLVPHP